MVIEDLINVLKTDKPEKQATHSAVVSKVDEEGTVWVYVAGSEKETPTASSSFEVKPGDSVNVEWRNNKLYIAGNYSNPAAGVTRVANVERDALSASIAAKSAVDDANTAQQAAESALDSAERASGYAERALASAESAQGSAESADTSATLANASANNALTQLGVVEKVVDILSWISEHGEYGLTNDESAVEGKYYFSYDGTSYAVVTSLGEDDDPHALGYYELTDVDSAVSNYINTHLALTNDGLYLQTSGATGYKVLVSPTDGMVMYGSAGQVVAQYGDTALIGEKTGFHIEVDGTELGFYEGETKVAYINNNTLHIAQSVVLNEMQVGEQKWSWKIDPNDDSIYLKWIG